MKHIKYQVVIRSNHDHSSKTESAVTLRRSKHRCRATLLLDERRCAITRIFGPISVQENWICNRFGEVLRKQMGYKWNYWPKTSLYTTPRDMRKPTRYNGRERAMRSALRKDLSPTVVHDASKRQQTQTPTGHILPAGLNLHTKVCKFYTAEGQRGKTLTLPLSTRRVQK